MHTALKILIGLVFVGEVQSEMKIVDLTHYLNNQSFKWPTFRDFVLSEGNGGTLEGVGNYISKDLALAEHTGTHIDAPVHFTRGKTNWYLHEIPVERLVVPLVLIDIREEAKENRDYVVTVDDITSWEDEFGKIKKGSIVLFFYGWADKWGNFEEAFGSKTKNTSTFHFPGISLEVAKLVASRGVYGVGTDVMSIDAGPALTFPAHFFLLDENIYILENVNDMSGLPKGGKGVTVFVGALKTEMGTGSPIRLIGTYDDEATDADSSSRNLGYTMSALVATLCLLCY